MRQGQYAAQERLPRESVLAEQMNISRTQLWDILASLEREGFITRRHGVGTIINHHVLGVATRMDIEVEFLDMIRRCGYEAGIKSVRVWEKVSDAQVANQLQIEEGTPVIQISRVCTANGQSVIYCVDTVERARVQDGYTQADLELPVFHFLRHFCGIVPYMDLTNLRSVTAQGELAEIFGVDEGTPLIKMEEVNYDIEGKAVFCSTEYFRDDIIPLTVMRKRL